nr:signal peptidase complex subunit 1 [Cavia porcellus]
MNSLSVRGRGFRNPAALRRNPSRMRDASARSPPRPKQAVRRTTANCQTTRRLATTRGGATVCSGLSLTSASGAEAVELRASACSLCDLQCQALAAEVSPYWLRLLRCLPPLIMLEHLSSLPTQMDYKGQKLAEQMFQGIILFSAIVGFIYGYLAEQFGWTVYIVMAGFALSCLLTLPPWPIYRRHPLKWLPVQESGTEDKKSGDRKIKRHAKNN